MRIVQFFGWTLILTIASIKLNAQDILSDSGIHVGERVPDEFTVDVINHSSSKIRIADLRGKLVILDWWSTNCSPCIGAMPHMEALQKKYGDKIFILPITDQRKGKIDSFWKSNPVLSKVKLPSAVSAKHGRNYFPGNTVPYEVWIDPSGTVIGLTNAEYVNEKEIDAVLAGKKMNWPNFSKVDYDLNEAFLSAKYPYVWGDKASVYYTAIYPRLERSGDNIEKVTVDSVNKVVRYYWVNWSLQRLYMAYFNTPGNSLVRTRQFVNLKEPERYDGVRKGYYGDWMMQNTFCVEMVLPLGVTKQEIQKKLVSELNTRFRLNGRVEKREIDCMLIQEIPPSRSPMKRTGTDSIDIVTSAKSLANLLNLQKGNPYVIDETNNNNKGKMYLVISSSTNLPEIRSAINSLGLDLVPAKRSMEVFCLDDIE